MIRVKNTFNGSQGYVIGLAEGKQDKVKEFGRFNSGAEYPIVKFLARDILLERVILTAVTTIALESALGVNYFSRDQVPLMRS